MATFVLVLHIIACFALVVLVLLQSGKEGMGVIFGGGSASVFGSIGAGGVLVKLTTFIAIIFLCTSLGYNIVTSSSVGNKSRFADVEMNGAATAQPAPAVPVQPVAPADAQAPASTPAAQ